MSHGFDGFSSRVRLRPCCYPAQRAAVESLTYPVVVKGRRDGFFLETSRNAAGNLLAANIANLQMGAF